jgi:glutaryl-CoA dehydrogenase
VSLAGPARVKLRPVIQPGFGCWRIRRVATLDARASTDAARQERSMAGFSGVDFIDFDSQLDDEEKLVRQTARQFVENEVIPIIEKHNREATFPKHLVPQLGELGFFGANLQGYGCAGMSNVAYGLVNQELERGDSGLRSFVSVQSALVMYPIYTYGSDAQKNKWLPLLQQGKAIGCFGLTEPQFGSNPGGMLTRAVKKGSKYVLNGEKMWITSGSIADVAVVWAKCEDEKIRGFLVEKGTPGFKAWDVHGKWSLRASVTSGLAFTDCEIPEANLLPNVTGLKGPLGCLNQARYGIGWGALGAAMACYDTALQYAKTRKQFANKPIASHQLVQEKLAWMITEIVKGQLLALHVGRLKDKGKVDPSHISMLKMNNVAIALETARKARDILGANGIVDDYCIMRHMNNLESVSTYEGTNDIHKLVIGERITGISAFF